MMKKIAPPYGLAVNEVRTKSMTDQGSNPNGGQKPDDFSYLPRPW